MLVDHCGQFAALEIELREIAGIGHRDFRDRRLTTLVRPTASPSKYENAQSRGISQRPVQGDFPAHTLHLTPKKLESSSNFSCTLYEYVQIHRHSASLGGP